MAWEENSCICLNMQLIAILSRIGVILFIPVLKTNVCTEVSLIFVAACKQDVHNIFNFTP